MLQSALFHPPQKSGGGGGGGRGEVWTEKENIPIQILPIILLLNRSRVWIQVADTKPILFKYKL